MAAVCPPLPENDGTLGAPVRTIPARPALCLIVEEAVPVESSEFRDGVGLIRFPLGASRVMDIPADETISLFGEVGGTEDCTFLPTSLAMLSALSLLLLLLLGLILIRINFDGAIFVQPWSRHFRQHSDPHPDPSPPLPPVDQLHSTRAATHDKYSIPPQPTRPIPVPPP